MSVEMNAIPLSESYNQTNSIRWEPVPRVFSTLEKPRYFERDFEEFLSKSMDSFILTLEKWKNMTITDPTEDTRLERDLESILLECSKPDWDGYDAEPIDIRSVRHVLDFLYKKPKDISYPDLAAEPNGDLTMVWRKNGYHLVVGINSERCIEWGGTSPSGHIYGDVQFDNDIPEEIIHLLRLVEGH